jgi:dUTP pyrophosphatase
VEIKFQCVTQFINAYQPSFESQGASGVDLRADIPSEYTIQPNGFYTISTGLCFEIPIGFEGQVRSRSGLASKSGIFMLNAPGTIDADFRGVVGVIAANFSSEPFIIRPADRIAQFVISPVPKVTYKNTDQLSETKRGAGGFGSTGV